MAKLIKFKIFSIDGKFYEDEVEAIYLDVPSSGVIGILPSRISYYGILDISTFYIVKDNKKVYFAVSDGLINYRNNEAIILARNYEREDEIDKERVERDRDEALKKLKEISKKDEDTYSITSYTLKKALNRLKLLK